MGFGRNGRDFNSIFAEPRMSNPFLKAEMARAKKEAGAVADAQAFMAPTRPYDERAFESKLIDNRLEEALKKLLGHGAPKY